MKTAIIIILCIALIIASIELYQTHKRLQFWQKNAVYNGRARIKRDAENDAEKGQIHRRAAFAINEQNKVIEDLQEEVKRLTRMNEIYKRQIERRSK